MRPITPHFDKLKEELVKAKQKKSLQKKSINLISLIAKNKFPDKEISDLQHGNYILKRRGGPGNRNTHQQPKHLKWDL